MIMYIQNFRARCYKCNVDFTILILILCIIYVLIVYDAKVLNNKKNCLSQ